jgi:hypothetical protein
MRDEKYKELVSRVIHTRCLNLAAAQGILVGVTCAVPTGFRHSGGGENGW